VAAAEVSACFCAVVAAADSAASSAAMISSNASMFLCEL